MENLPDKGGAPGNVTEGSDHRDSASKEKAGDNSRTKDKESLQRCQTNFGGSDNNPSGGNPTVDVIGELDLDGWTNLNNIRHCFRHRIHLTDWEKKFVDSVWGQHAYGRALSHRQLAVLDGIFGKVKSLSSPRTFLISPRKGGGS